MAAGLAISVSVQTGAPELQAMAPLSQTFAGAVSVQLMPFAQALHAPLSQTPLLALHDVPLAPGFAIPVSVQTATPVPQVICPLSQTLAGVQELPAAQLLHVPLLQTPLGTALHAIPFIPEFAAPVSMQTEAPLLQFVSP